MFGGSTFSEDRNLFFFFVNVNRRDITVVWSVTKALVFRLTAFLGIHLLWEYSISSFDLFYTYIVS